MQDTLDDAPLVSVGIPTHNRPSGLRRTLHQIRHQTYPNLEIIVSDNCSENAEVVRICREAEAVDSRVACHRQARNIGAAANFRFLFERATGPFFMWAADDDEWHPRFIETCLRNIGTAGLAMQDSFKIRFRGTTQEECFSITALSERRTAYENAMDFLNKMHPALLYGLFRREKLLNIVRDFEMDGSDFSIVLHVALKHGINTFPEQLFTLGVEGDAYQHKPIVSGTNRLFRHWPSIRVCLREIVTAPTLSLKEKYLVSERFLARRLWAFSKLEVAQRPVQAQIALAAAKVYSYCVRRIWRRTV